MIKGQRLQVTIERPGYGGDGVAHAADGRVLFVRGGAPGDRLEVRLTQVRRRFLRGERTRLLEPGPQTIEAFCPAGERCGGCPWQRIPQALQREALQAHVQRGLDRAARDQRGGPPRWYPLVATEPWEGWRSTTRLHWAGGRLGHHRPGTRAVVDLDDCPALTPPLRSLLRQARSLLLPHLGGQGVLRLTRAPGAPGGTAHLAPARSSARSPARGSGDPLAGALRALLAAPSSSCHGGVLRGRAGSVKVGDPRDTFEGVPHPAGAFVQGHRPGGQALVAGVLEWLGAIAPPPAPLTELFAGSGHFTVPLARAGYRVQAVEIDPTAAAQLRETVRLSAGLSAGLSVEVRCGDALAPGRGISTQILLIDPPRGGAGALCDRLAADPGPLRCLLYVSCHLATLARDVSTLIGGGWRLAAARAYNLFPHTGHVEVLALLQREPPGPRIA